MSYNFFRDHNNQQWPRRYSNKNVVNNAPFSYFNHGYYFDQFDLNDGCEHLIHRPSPQPINNFAKPSPPANMCIGMSGRVSAKAKFRFHGGIGDGCGGLACWVTNEETFSPRLLQLFDDMKIDMLMRSPNAGFVQTTLICPPVWPVEASGGTGVFLPVYSKKIRNKKGMQVCGGRGGTYLQHLDGQTKKKGVFAKTLASEVGIGEKDAEEFDEIPIELLLPQEWTY